MEGLGDSLQLGSRQVLRRVPQRPRGIPDIRGIWTEDGLIM